MGKEKGREPYNAAYKIPTESYRTSAAKQGAENRY